MVSSASTAQDAAKLISSSENGLRIEVTTDGKRYVADIPMSSGMQVNPVAQ